MSVEYYYSANTIQNPFLVPNIANYFPFIVPYIAIFFPFILPNQLLNSFI